MMYEAILSSGKHPANLYCVLSARKEVTGIVIRELPMIISKRHALHNKVKQSLTKSYDMHALLRMLIVFCPICVCWPIRVWDVPYAYTHMGRPYAYGTTSCPI